MRQDLHTLGLGNVEENAASQNRLDRIDVVFGDACSVGLAPDRIRPAEELAAQREVTERVDVGTHVPAQCNRLRRGAHVSNGIVAVGLAESIQEGRMIGMVRHAHVVGLGQIDLPRVRQSAQ